MSSTELKTDSDLNSNPNSTLKTLPAGQPLDEARRIRWLHRLAVLMVCLTWPLIWIGGLVTTYDAGMAVPDWPGTYGYNMFLYPWKTWLLGPFDLLIEHGHRLLGATVGLVAIGGVIAAVMTERRRWVLCLSIGALAAVCLQGALGGMRVRLDARTLAMIHGCFGPVFFCLCVILAGVTGPVWWRVSRTEKPNRVGFSGKLARWLTIAAFLQLLVGSQLRHVQSTFSATGFRHLVWTHLALAFIVLLLVIWHVWRTRGCGDLTLGYPAAILLALVTLQVGLGVMTWVVNYGVPWMLADWRPVATYVVQAKGWWESLITTAHVAIGSLILAMASLAWLRWRRAAWRIRAEPAAAISTG